MWFRSGVYAIRRHRCNRGIDSGEGIALTSNPVQTPVWTPVWTPFTGIIKSSFRALNR